MKRLSNSPCALLVSLVFLLANSFAYATSPPDSDGDGVAESTITQISSSGLHACVLDAVGVRCFGIDNSEHGTTTVPVLSNPVAIAAGLALSCAIDDGGVKCWSKYPVMKAIPTLVNPFAITAAYNFGCALDVTGAHCWGASSSVKNNIPTLINPTVLNASYNHACAIDAVGVHCWGGTNSAGELNVPALVNPVAVAAGYLHTCAIDNSGVHCWGDNSEGQLNVPTLQNPVSISAGGYETCAIDDNGVHCWGFNQLKVSDTWTVVNANGDGVCGLDATSAHCSGGVQFDEGDNCPAISNTDQLDTDKDYQGDACDSDDDNDAYTDAQEIACGSNTLSAGSICPASTPADIDGDGVYDSATHPLQLSAGAYHSCALDITGVSCWGANIDDQTTAPALSTPLMVSAGGYHSCALDITGLKCWGQSNYLQLSIPTLINPVSVTAGLYHTCALDGSVVKCWGADDQATNTIGFGQAVVPVDLGSAVAVSAGGYHTCAITSAGAVRCWGDNVTNQLTVPTLNNPTAISAGLEHTCALDNTGVKCWGVDDKGQSTVPTLSNPTAISAGFKHSCALDASGVKCWGDNSAGQTNVPALTNPTAVSAGGYHSCAIDASGVTCWGDNSLKQTATPTHSLFNYIADNCPIANADQLNTDGDSQGNACDLDDDNDTVPDTTDAFPLNSAESVDTDSDAVGDNADNCPIANTDQLNTDGDAEGNVCDLDDDNDGVADTSDAFPLNSAESVDTDGDTVGDNGDNCPLIVNADLFNTDGDSQGNACDLDDDNDGVFDVSDSQPLLQNSKSKLISVATKDGWLLESTETSKKGGKADSGSSTLIVGDSVKNQEYRSILHFDTASLPNNAVITKVTLTLKKQSLKGDVKPLGNLVVDMKQKNFGSSTSLAVNDFEATAGKLSVGTFKASGSTYTATLNSTGRGYISKTAATQFKIHFTKDDNNDKGDDYLKFYSGSASTSSRPSLVIEYYVP